jgi:hypothetical protein
MKTAGTLKNLIKDIGQYGIIAKKTNDLQINYVFYHEMFCSPYTSLPFLEN